MSAEVEAERDDLRAAIAAAMREYSTHIKAFHPTRMHDPDCAGCRIGLVLSRERPAKPDGREELQALVDASEVIRRLEALCARAEADDGTVFEDPMPLPGWVQLIRNAIRGPEGDADAPSPVTAATEAHGETTEAQEGSR